MKRTQPDGTVVVAEIGAYGDAGPAAAVRRARAWAGAFEAKLIAAVTDKRIERFPSTTP